MGDWPEDDSPRNPPTTTLRPVFVAVLIVVACAALAVWTLKNPYTPPPLPAAPVQETPSPTPAAARKISPSVRPRPTGTWVVPTLPPTAPPVSEATAAATATRPPATPTPPPTATPAPAAGTPDEPPSLRNVAPPRVKKGSTTLLDVRGKGLRAEHRAFVLRGGKVPLEIGVPRQRFVDATLVQVLIVVAPNAPKGEYELAVADGSGRRSNNVKFEVTQ